MFIRMIPEHIIEDKRLGRHVEHDPRSRSYGFGVTVAFDGLKRVEHRHYGSVLDQGQIGSCTGNATAQAINSVPLHKKGKHLLKEPDAVDLYELATHLDPYPGAYPPDDTGSSGLAAAKAATQKGYITSYKHAFSIEEALAALQERPVITGVEWYEGFDNPDDKGYVQIEGQVRGGHEFVIVGFEPGDTLDDSLVKAINSWGKGWGKDGHFMFSVASWRTLLDNQGDVTILS